MLFAYVGVCWAGRGSDWGVGGGLDQGHATGVRSRQEIEEVEEEKRLAEEERRFKENLRQKVHGVGGRGLDGVRASERDHSRGGLRGDERCCCVDFLRVSCFVDRKVSGKADNLYMFLCCSIDWSPVGAYLLMLDTLFPIAFSMLLVASRGVNFIEMNSFPSLFLLILVLRATSASHFPRIVS